MKKNTDKIIALVNATKGRDKDKLTLVTRKLATGKWYYIKDYSKTPPKWFAIGTQDEQIARRVHTELTSTVAYGESEIGTIIQLNIAKLDRDTQSRTWQDVYKHFCGMGQRQSTLATYNSAWNKSEYDGLRTTPVIETTRSQFLDAYREGNTNHQQVLKNIFNHAKREGWLVNQNLIVPNEWGAYRKTTGGTTAAITVEMHFAIVAAMEKDLANWDCKNRRMQRRCKTLTQEVKSILEVLWELGASNSDAKGLSTDNINWDTGHVVFKRKKWKGTGTGNKRTRRAIKFPMGQKLKDIILPYYNTAIQNGGGYLFPKCADTMACNVLRVFQTYQDVAGVPRIVLDEDGQERRIIIHSYRYRMAEHLFEIGATEKEAKSLMGWNSREVMLAYSEGTEMQIPALDVMAEERGHNRVIKIAKAA